MEHNKPLKPQALLLKGKKWDLGVKGLFASSTSYSLTGAVAVACLLLYHAFRCRLQSTLVWNVFIL